MLRAPPLAKQPNAVTVILGRWLVLQMLAPIDEEDVGDERIAAEGRLVLLAQIFS
jgi:hypothetical protein